MVLLQDLEYRIKGIFIIHSANHNVLDGILAIADDSTVGLNPIFSNGITCNEVNYNGGNGISSWGNNAINLNDGRDNTLIGIMSTGNPLLLGAPNSVDGHCGTTMPPIVQMLDLPGYINVLGPISYVVDVIPEWISSLQSKFNENESN